MLSLKLIGKIQQCSLIESNSWQKLETTFCVITESRVDEGSRELWRPRYFLCWAMLRGDMRQDDQWSLVLICWLYLILDTPDQDYHQLWTISTNWFSSTTKHQVSTIHSPAFSVWRQRAPAASVSRLMESGWNTTRTRSSAGDHSFAGIKPWEHEPGSIEYFLHIVNDFTTAHGDTEKTDPDQSLSHTGAGSKMSNIFSCSLSLGEALEVSICWIFLLKCSKNNFQKGRISLKCLVKLSFVKN